MLALLLASALAADVDLEPLFAEAWAQNPDVARARAEVTAAEGDFATTAVVLPNPTVESGVRTDVVFANEGELSFEVGLVQDLAWPGARWARKDGAERALAAARLRLALARLDVASRIETSAARWAAARDSLAAREEMLRLARALSEAGRRRLQAGAGTSLEATLSAADEASAEAAASAARSELKAAATELCAILGRDLCAPEPVSDWPALSPLPEKAPDIGARADVQSAAAERDAAGFRLDAAALDRLPQARLAAGYVLERTVLDSPVLPEPARDTDHLLGVALSITLPIWDWKTGEILRARSDKERAEAAHRATLLAVRRDVTTALARFEAATLAEGRLASVAKDVDQALADVERGYTAGALSLAEALATRDRLLRARIELFEAKRQKVDAHAAVLRAFADPALVGAQVTP